VFGICVERTTCIRSMRFVVPPDAPRRRAVGRAAGGVPGRAPPRRHPGLKPGAIKAISPAQGSQSSPGGASPARDPPSPPCPVGACRSKPGKTNVSASVPRTSMVEMVDGLQDRAAGGVIYEFPCAPGDHPPICRPLKKMRMAPCRIPFVSRFRHLYKRLCLVGSPTCIQHQESDFSARTEETARENSVDSVDSV
jgi:hypothetical protein